MFRQFCIASLFFLAACSHRTPELSQMEIREMQSTTFTGMDAKTVLKEMVHVLQDNAFIVKTANLELGVLTGEKDVDIESTWAKIFTTTRKKNTVTELTANVTQYGADTKVRVTIRTRLFDNFGRILKVRQINDPVYYQQFFSKVHEGLMPE